MLADIKKVSSLLRLATNEGTSEHERLSAAKRALEIVERLEKGRVTIPKTPPPREEVRPVWRNPADEIFAEAIRNASHRTSSGARPVPRGNADTRLKANAHGDCCECGKPYSKGTAVVFLRKERRFCHPDCYSKRTSRVADSP